MYFKRKRVISRLPSESAIFEVDECILREKELSLDYNDSGEPYHIKAITTNNFNYSGHFEGRNERGSITLKHYKNDSSHLFYGRWISGNQEGTYLFELDED
jgi:hypothetical protein